MSFNSVAYKVFVGKRCYFYLMIELFFFCKLRTMCENGEKLENFQHIQQKGTHCLFIGSYIMHINFINFEAKTIFQTQTKNITMKSRNIDITW